MRLDRTLNGGVRAESEQIAAMAPPFPVGKPAQSRKEVQISPVIPQVPARRSPHAIAESSSAVALRGDLASSISRLAITGCTTVERNGTYVSRSESRSEDQPVQAPSTTARVVDSGGKKLTSSITFLMDERESLRPDDSASTKTGDDFDSNTAPIPLYPNPGTGSDIAAKAFRDQFMKISESIGPVPIPLPTYPIVRRILPSMSVNNANGALPMQPVRVPSPVAIPRIRETAVAHSNGNAFEYPYQKPDEKLFEALESPKDRLFLLRLEQEIISFVRDSRYDMIWNKDFLSKN